MKKLSEIFNMKSMRRRNLPDECWESVFKLLSYLKSLSTVSKQFLSITNRLRFLFTRFNISQQQQVSLSQIKSTTMVARTDFYLPDDCWESVFKFLITNGDNWTHRRYFKSLSVVSKQFLSITNRLRFTLTIRNQTHPFLPCLFQRFTNLTSLDLEYYYGDLNKLLEEISHFPLNLTSLSLHYTIPADGLQAFSRKITTLTSLSCILINSLRRSDLCLIADCFPNLKLLDLSYSYNISEPEEGIGHVSCFNIRHLNLSSSRVNLFAMNFEVPKLEVLDLSFTRADDKTLYVISKSCPGLLQLGLVCCKNVTEKGVKDVAENCIQLREINLRGCLYNVVASMISSRPSLRKIIVFP